MCPSSVGKPIDWNEGFCLYMTSKLSNPKFSPEIMNKTNVINYQVCQTEGKLQELSSLLIVYTVTYPHDKGCAG